jgi:hypothetical protein
MTALSPIRFIPFEQFKELGSTPRLPENRNLCVVLEEIDLETSLLIFVSHCWLRGFAGAEGWDGRPHPDNAEEGKYKLIVEGVEKMLKVFAPGMKNCFLWLDYGCIDQNGDPAGELKQLDKIVEVCDCLLTPIYDENHAAWTLSRSGNGLFEDYESTGWKGTDYSYVNRGWCRVEMFYGANIPLKEDSPERKEKMKGVLLFQRSEGRRPHFLYGSKESKLLVPRLLEPLQTRSFEKYHPSDGHFTVTSDREKIIQLVTDLEPYMKRVEEGYVGERKDGKMHGKGKYTYADGNVYEGKWKDDKMHGNGKYAFADGNVYKGESKDDKKHGKGKYIFANGNVYDGEWKDDKKHGKGKFTYADGNVHKGEWKDGKLHGKGKFTYADGNMYKGEWKDDKKHGIFIFRAKSNCHSIQFEEGIPIPGTMHPVQPKERSCVVM